MLLLRRRHGGIELDQHVTGLHALAIVNLNGSYDASFERLNQLDAAARYHLAGGGRDDIDVSECCPEQRQNEERHNGSGNRATHR